MEAPVSVLSPHITPVLLSSILLLWMARQETFSMATLALDNNEDADTRETCSLGLALLDCSPRCLGVLVLGWLCVVIADVCSVVLKTPAATRALDVVAGTLSLIWLLLTYVRGGGLPTPLKSNIPPLVNR